jgi:hypothetical protein
MRLGGGGHDVSRTGSLRTKLALSLSFIGLSVILPPSQFQTVELTV